MNTTLIKREKGEWVLISGELGGSRNCGGSARGGKTWHWPSSPPTLPNQMHSSEQLFLPTINLQCENACTGSLMAVLCMAAFGSHQNRACGASGRSTAFLCLGIQLPSFHTISSRHPPFCQPRNTQLLTNRLLMQYLEK